MKKWDDFILFARELPVWMYCFLSLAFITVGIMFLGSPYSSLENPEIVISEEEIWEPEKLIEITILDADENHPPSEELLKNIEELKFLYKELQGFKDDPEFHKVGFGLCCKFNLWLQKVDSFQSKKTNQDILNYVGFLPGELSLLGMEYMRNKGHPASHSELENIISAGLSRQG